MTQVETATASAAAAECRVDTDSTLPANADEQVLGKEVAVATPTTTHAALVGVKNAIDASYVSCQRHLSRRVTQQPAVKMVF